MPCTLSERTEHNNSIYNEGKSETITRREPEQVNSFKFGELMGNVPIAKIVGITSV